mmetsp:Transcript_6271/g.9116  ORF Transcript_6271/g.9116 Transcript_6271/m.9116 type:complete len:210 (+) Transcript_6271:26-655(+)
MISLFSNLYEYITKKEEIYLLLVGLDGSGKTTLSEGIKTIYTKKHGLKPSEIIPTIGMNVVKFETNEANVTIWDLGGEKELRSIWNEYYKSCHGLILVAKINDESRKKELMEELQKLDKDERLKDVPIYIVLNHFIENNVEEGHDSKTKIRDSNNQELLDLDFELLSSTRKVNVFTIDAANLTDVDRSVNTMVDQLLKKKRTINSEDFV